MSRYCVECAHHSEVWSTMTQKHERICTTKKRSLVTGELYDHVVTCDKNRSDDGECGPRGRLFTRTFDPTDMRDCHCTRDESLWCDEQKFPGSMARCTRLSGHSGDHIACDPRRSPSKHRLDEWPR